MRVTQFSRALMGICGLVAAVASSGLHECQAEEPPTAGEARWYGELDATDRRFRFVLEELPAVDEAEAISPQGDGQAPAARWQLRSIDEGGNCFPLESWIHDDDQLRFELPIVQARYSGNKREGGGHVVFEGTWQQRGNTLPLDFREVGREPVPPPAEEVWAGTLNAIVQKLDLRFRITRDAAGLRTAWMDSVTQQAGGFRGDLGITADTWTIDVPAVRGRFEGTLSDDGKTLAGSWSQSGVSLPLKLARSADQPPPPPAAKSRPQTPQPPFPYRSEEVRFRNAAQDVTLAGTLTIPEGDGPFPAVLLITGSGPQDRDETLFEHKPFAVLADFLTRRGIAVLRHDDRGVGGSTQGPPDATSEDLAGDALSGWEFLSRREEIDATRIGFIGHSEGAMLATMAASGKPAVACVVMLAGAGVDGRQVLLSQGRRILEAEGLANPEQIERQRVLQEVLMNTVEDAPPGASSEAMAAEAAKRLRETLPGESPPGEDLDALAAAGVARLSAPWFRFFLEFDPATPLSTLECPVLALVGSNDVQVDAATNLPPLRAAVVAAGNPASIVEELPELNHLFQTATTGAVSEYDTIEETIAPQVLMRVADWLAEQFTSDAERQKTDLPQ
jgi:pimeloyl-ACP methyl ester carboxylesterase